MIEILLAIIVIEIGYYLNLQKRMIDQTENIMKNSEPIETVIKKYELPKIEEEKDGKK